MKKSLNLSSLLPHDTSNFFTYHGSLTTPECNEVVVWNIFTETHAISWQQVKFCKMTGEMATQWVNPLPSDCWICAPPTLLCTPCSPIMNFTLSSLYSEYFNGNSYDLAPVKTGLCFNKVFLPKNSWGGVCVREQRQLGTY